LCCAAFGSSPELKEEAALPGLGLVAYLVRFLKKKKKKKAQKTVRTIKGNNKNTTKEKKNSLLV